MFISRQGREWMAAADRHNDLVLKSQSGHFLLPSARESVDFAEMVYTALNDELVSTHLSSALYVTGGIIPLGDRSMHYEVAMYGVLPSRLAQRGRRKLEQSRVGNVVTWRPKPSYKALASLAFYSDVMDESIFPAVEIYFLPVFDRPTLCAEGAKFEIHAPFSSTGMEQVMPLNEATIPECRALVATYFGGPV